MNINDHPHKFRFNRENARENAAKSWEARRQRKAKLELEAQQGRLSTPQSERLALQIERIEQMIEKTTDANTLQKLTASHSRLFSAWQVLTRTPNPGSFKPKAERRAQMPTIDSGSWGPVPDVNSTNA